MAYIPATACFNKLSISHRMKLTVENEIDSASTVVREKMGIFWYLNNVGKYFGMVSLAPLWKFDVVSVFLSHTPLYN